MKEKNQNQNPYNFWDSEAYRAKRKEIEEELKRMNLRLEDIKTLPRKDRRVNQIFQAMRCYFVLIKVKYNTIIT